MMKRMPFVLEPLMLHRLWRQVKRKMNQTNDEAINALVDAIVTAVTRKNSQTEQALSKEIKALKKKVAELERRITELSNR